LKLEKQVKVEIIRILSYFQEEMMVKEDPNKLEKKMIAWRAEKMHIKKS